MADAGHEPSMEEILSSIKRIIAEDSAATLAPRAKRAVVTASADPVILPDVDYDGPDVLELTDPVAVEIPSKPASAPSSPVAAPRIAMPPPAVPQAAEPAAEVAPTLVSATTADASRSSLAALSSMIVRPETVGSDTLEGLVRQMLKPMLADWLDAKLPDLVERLVAAEIRRITERP